MENLELKRSPAEYHPVYMFLLECLDDPLKTLLRLAKSHLGVRRHAYMKICEDSDFLVFCFFYLKFHIDLI